ncbi:MAG: c-type cytochrome domain-containing protein [Blastocatellia bacterium]
MSGNTAQLRGINAQYEYDGWLRAHQSSAQEIAGLLAIVERDLADATGAISPDWRFGIAYNAALKLCTILLHASGFGFANRGFHASLVAFIMVRLKVFIIVVALIAVIIGMANRRSVAARTTNQQAAEILFAEKILPVLEAKCQACHTAESAQSGLDLSSRAALLKGGARGAAVIPGDAAQSLLIVALTGADEKRVKRMPPGGKPLDAEIIAAFKQWIDAGAPWPQLNAAARAEKSYWDKYQDADIWAFKKNAGGQSACF